MKKRSIKSCQFSHCERPEVRIYCLSFEFSYKKTAAFNKGQVSFLTTEVTSADSLNTLGVAYSEKMGRPLLLSTWHLRQPGQRRKRFA